MDALLKLFTLMLIVFGVGLVGALLINALLAGGEGHYEPPDAQAEAARDQELLDHEWRMREREAWLADDFHGDFGGDDRY